MILIGGLLLLAGCSQTGGKPTAKDSLQSQDTLQARAGKDSMLTDSLVVDTTRIDGTRMEDTVRLLPAKDVNTGNTKPEELVRFAETLKGIPYVYASSDPKVGFDCSGFITHVFNRFRIAVPRSSIEFTNVGKEIPVGEAKRGDIILFTGTNPQERFVGHMGIVVSNTDTLRFIHSTSGKAMSVTVTPLNEYYKGRFVKTLRVFPQNDQ